MENIAKQLSFSTIIFAPSNKLLQTMRFTFNKVNPYRKFQFEPRYFDPEKEELDSRVAVSESDAKYQGKDHRDRISDAFQKKERQVKKTIYIRLLLVIVLTVLLMAVYIWLTAKLKG